MNNYYTPDIEEFCVGFEYELHTSTVGVSVIDFENNLIEHKVTSNTKVWEKVTYTLNPATYRSLKEIETLITDKKIRVKYLNKEDIKSLGYTEESRKIFVKIAPGSLGYWSKLSIDYRWWDVDVREISIVGIRGSEDEKLFVGSISNITELKNIIKKITNV